MHSYTLSTADEARWRAILPAHVSVVGSVEYAKLCERLSGCPARLFVIEAGAPIAAYPFFVRPVRDLPFAQTSELWDSFTPAYTGPLALGTTPAPGFAEAFSDHCRANNIVAEFAHLNPWRVPDDHLDTTCVEKNREIVYADLTWSEEMIWNKSMNSDSRRQTKQAQRAGVLIRRAESSADIERFHQLHTKTMDRRQAHERYYYPPGHFEEVFRTMPDNAFFALAEYQGQVVAGGLFFHDDTEVHWDLSAADLEFSSVRPVNGYVYDTIIWAVRNGKKRMLMGGAYQPGDGVFRFKASYSPLRAQFCTYRRIHDAPAYLRLTEAWANHHGVRPHNDFFPAYRASAPAPVASKEAS